MSRGFSSSARQQTNASRPFGLMLRRMLLNAAAGSVKNITPNREKATSNEAGSKGNTCASAWTNRTRSHPLAARFANASTAADRSTPRLCRPARRPGRGPALSRLRHSLCPGCSHQDSVQAPAKPADQGERVAVPIAPGPLPTHARVLRLGSARGHAHCSSLGSHSFSTPGGECRDVEAAPGRVSRLGERLASRLDVMVGQRRALSFRRVM